MWKKRSKIFLVLKNYMFLNELPCTSDLVITYNKQVFRKDTNRKYFVDII